MKFDIDRAVRFHIVNTSMNRIHTALRHPDYTNSELEITALGRTITFIFRNEMLGMLIKHTNPNQPRQFKVTDDVDKYEILSAGLNWALGIPLVVGESNTNKSTNKPSGPAPILGEKGCDEVSGIPESVYARQNTRPTTRFGQKLAEAQERKYNKQDREVALDTDWTWQTTDGRIIPLTKMSTKHMLNCLEVFATGKRTVEESFNRLALPNMMAVLRERLKNRDESQLRAIQNLVAEYRQMRIF